jgi:capsular exopolysaccharide synthesis family protein
MEEFDLKRFAKTAWHKRIIIITVIVISIILGYCYSYFFVTPKYQSTAKIVLTKVESTDSTDDEGSIAQSDITLNNSLVDTYSDIIKSKTVLKTVKDNLNLEETEDDLDEMISVAAGNTAAILTITVSNEDAEYAMKVTNEIADVFSEQIETLYGINNVNILDRAELAETPYNINHVKDIAIFAVLGIFISGGIILIIYMLDTTIKQAEDIESIGMQVAGIIPLYEKDVENKMNQNKGKQKKSSSTKKNKDSELVVLENAKSPITEAFRTLRTSLSFASGTKKIKNILITSTNSQDGKSYVSANLATMFAKANKKVILVDADMRKGRQNKIFKLSNSQGLSNCLIDMTSRARLELTQMTKYVKTTKVPNLHIITSGDRPSNPAELLSSTRIVRLLEILDSMYDIVIIDGTPSAIVSDSLTMAKYVDAVLAVASYKTTKLETLSEIKKSYENVGGKINGVILNKFPISKNNYTESYYYDDNREKDENIEFQEVQSKTVAEIIEEASKKLKNRNEYQYQENSNFDEKSLSNINIENVSMSNGNNYLEYKIENITNELAIIKNLFIQSMVDNQKIDPRDIAEIKNEISNMKQMLDLRQDLDTSKEIREEIESVREMTESLVDSQKANNEKVKRFIEEYRNRKR